MANPTHYGSMFDRLHSSEEDIQSVLGKTELAAYGVGKRRGRLGTQRQPTVPTTARGRQTAMRTRRRRPKSAIGEGMYVDKGTGELVNVRGIGLNDKAIRELRKKEELRNLREELQKANPGATASEIRRRILQERHPEAFARGNRIQAPFWEQPGVIEAAGANRARQAAGPEAGAAASGGVGQNPWTRIDRDAISPQLFNQRLESGDITRGETGGISGVAGPTQWWSRRSQQEIDDQKRQAQGDRDIQARQKKEIDAEVARITEERKIAGMSVQEKFLYMAKQNPGLWDTYKGLREAKGLVGIPPEMQESYGKRNDGSGAAGGGGSAPTTPLVSLDISSRDRERLFPRSWADRREFSSSPDIQNPMVTTTAGESLDSSSFPGASEGGEAFVPNGEPSQIKDLPSEDTALISSIEEREKTRQIIQDVRDKVAKMYPTQVELAERRRLEQKKLDDAMTAKANELTPEQQLEVSKAKEKQLDVEAQEIQHKEAGGLAKHYSTLTGRKITKGMMLNQFPEVMKIVKEYNTNKINELERKLKTEKDQVDLDAAKVDLDAAKVDLKKTLIKFAEFKSLAPLRLLGEAVNAVHDVSYFAGLVKNNPDLTRLVADLVKTENNPATKEPWTVPEFMEHLIKDKSEGSVPVTVKGFWAKALALIMNPLSAEVTVPSDKAGNPSEGTPLPPGDRLRTRRPGTYSQPG